MAAAYEITISKRFQSILSTRYILVTIFALRNIAFRFDLEISGGRWFLQAGK